MKTAELLCSTHFLLLAYHWKYLKMTQISTAFETLKSFQGLLIPLAPFLITKGYNWLTKARKELNSKSVIFVSQDNWAVIWILVACALVQIMVYIPLASPPINVFIATESRMQTSGDVIARRLQKLFGDQYEIAPKSLTSGRGFIDYDLLVSRLTSSDGRALYALYGTEAYGGCQWCRTDQPSTFFIYTLPSLILPHLLHFLPVLLVTSSEVGFFSFATTSSKQWYFVASIAGLIFAVAEVYAMYQAPNMPSFMTSIKDSLTPDNINWVFWSSVKLRAWGFAIYDLTLALLVYLSAAGIVFETHEITAVRTSKIIKDLDGAVGKLRSSILLHTNVISKSSEMREAFIKWGTTFELLEKALRKDPIISEARREAKNRISPGFRQLEDSTQAFVANVFES